MVVKVEKLQAGRELDAMVSEKLLGTEVCRCKICRDTGPNGSCEDCGKSRGKFYSTHVDRALAVLEHLATTRNLIYRIERTANDLGKPQYEVTLSSTAKKPVGRGSAASLALAACRAALSSL